jgi:hypothetical protein
MKLGFSGTGGDVGRHLPRHSAVLPRLFLLVGDILTQGLAERQGRYDPEPFCLYNDFFSVPYGA